MKQMHPIFRNILLLLLFTAFNQSAIANQQSWLIHLAVSSDAVEVIKCENRPIAWMILPDVLREGEWIEYEVLSSENTVLRTGKFRDPLVSLCQAGSSLSGEEPAAYLLRFKKGDFDYSIRFYRVIEGQRVGVGEERLKASGRGRGGKALSGNSGSNTNRVPAVITQVLSNGPDAGKLNFVFLSEGYRTNEQAKFNQHVRTAVQGIQQDSVFSRYKYYLNAYQIFVPSVESGASRLGGPTKDTYFGAYYGAGSIERALKVGYPSRVYELLSEFLPSYDIIVVLVNDQTNRGGLAQGDIATSWTGHDLAHVVLHEVGHSFGGLADEYVEAGKPPLPGPNVTDLTNRAQIPWTYWIKNTTPIPTPQSSGANVIGLFRGATYQSDGWYRSQLNCRMRNDAPFCKICMQELVWQLYRHVSPVVRLEPSPGLLTLRQTTNGVMLYSFQAEAQKLDSAPIGFQWVMNDLPIQGATNSVFQLNYSQIPLGSFFLELETDDPHPEAAPYIRTAVAHRYIWKITIKPYRPPLVLPKLHHPTFFAPEPERGLPSGFSFEVSVPHGFRVEQSTDLVNWEPVNPFAELLEGVFHHDMFTPPGKQRFYRAVFYEEE